MPLSLHHIVIDAHDLPALARFWAEALGWRILSEREWEVVIGPDETAPVGICFTPVTDRETAKNRTADAPSIRDVRALRQRICRADASRSRGCGTSCTADADT
ncbi:VOC family protein [Streptomyces sp. QTS52]